MNYEITNDPVSILTGTNVKTSRAYTEMAVNFNEASKEITPVQKNFILNAAKDVADLIQKNDSDPAIAASKGDLQAYKHYSTISNLVVLLTKSGITIPELRPIQSIISALNTNKNLYMQGYSANKDLVKLEYESAVYLIIEGLTNILVNEVDISMDQNNRTVIRSKKGIFRPKNVINKTVRDLALELNNVRHVDYLKAILEVKDTSVSSEKLTEHVDIDDTDIFTEAVGATAAGVIASINLLFSAGADILHNVLMFGPALWRGIKRIFNVFAIIRSIQTIRYHNKAKTIELIKQQIAFIELNINKIENKSNLPAEQKEAIINKQRRVIEAYRKRAEKLRAEFIEGEQDAAVALNQSNPDMGSAPASEDDDFVLA